MALLLIEGWDHLTSTQTTAKGWSVSASSMLAGRFDGQAARLPSSGLSKLLPSTYATIIGGFAFRTTHAPGTATGTFYAFRAGATNIMQLQLDSSNRIVVKNSGGTTIATGTTPLSTSTWYYIEPKLVVGTTGTCEVHLNGVSGEIASTTGNFGTTNADTIFVAGIASANTDFDDMYAVDTTGTNNNTFLGDSRVETLFPNGAGFHTAFTPNGAASNYLCVNETTPDDDTTYVSDSTVGDIDTYTFTDVDASATVFGIQRNLYARKDDANTRQIAAVVRQGGTDSVGATQTLSASYAVYSEIKDKDPTGATWTAANVNGNEWGVKVIA